MSYIQRLDCSKCGINQADTDKPFVALPMPFICQDCFGKQILAEERIKELEDKNAELMARCGHQAISINELKKENKELRQKLELAKKKY